MIKLAKVCFPSLKGKKGRRDFFISLVLLKAITVAFAFSLVFAASLVKQHDLDKTFIFIFGGGFSAIYLWHQIRLINQRMNDLELSAWAFLLIFIPYLGGAFYLYLFFKRDPPISLFRPFSAKEPLAA